MYQFNVSTKHALFSPFYDHLENQLILFANIIAKDV